MIKQNEAVTIKRSQIKLAGYNPRKITPEAKRKLRDNLGKVGLMGGLVWNERTGNLVSGHQRISILDSDKNYDPKTYENDYDVIVTKVDLDEKEEKAQNIFFNNQSAMGFFDEDKLHEIMKEVDFSEMTGFSKQNQITLFADTELTDEEYRKIAEKVEERSKSMKKISEKAVDEADANYVVLVFKNMGDKTTLIYGAERIMKEIKITCSYNETLKLDELTDFQGNLKIRTDADYRKIIKSIEKYGFSVPFFVWQNKDKNYVLDGHGRLKALQIMQEEGNVIDNVPVIYCKNIKNEKEAKDFLLRLNSSYGRMTKKSVAEFIGQDFDLNLDDFELPAFNLDFSSPFEQQIEPVDDAYKQAIAQRDYVSQTTTAPNPVVNERPLAGGIEQPESQYVSNTFEVGEGEMFTAPIEQIKQAPTEFKEFDTSIPTKCRCPKCGYEW